METFSEKTLRKAVNNYNQCDYSKYKPTNEEIKTSNSINNDQYKIFGGIGGAIKSISFFESSDKENLNQFGFQLGVLGSPHFFGSLQGSLYFVFQVSFNFGGEVNFTNSISPTSFSVNTHRMGLGLDYFFNKSGKVKPYLGIGVELATDYFKGDVDGLPFNTNVVNPIWSPKIGLLYSLGNGKDIGITFEYIPEYEYNLSFLSGDEVIPLVLKSSHFNFGLNYYF